MVEPNLRFPEFDDEWKEERLGELGKFYKGAKLSKSDISEKGIPCVLYGELYTKYDEVAYKIYSKTECLEKGLVYSKKNDVIIPASGETAEDISTATCLLQDGILLGGDLNIYRSSIDGRFISYMLNHTKKYDIARLAQGKSIVHIGEKYLSKIKISFPMKNEQEKIANFLSKIDEYITLQEFTVKKLEEEKKGLMQKIFSQEIRFKDDNGKDFPKWEEKKLGTICKVFAGGTPSTSIKSYWNGDINWLTSGYIQNCIIYEKDIDTKITKLGLEKSSAKLIKPNSVLLAMTGATCGNVGYLTFESSANQSVMALEPFCDIAKFIYYLLIYKNKYILKFQAGGAQAGINKLSCCNFVFDIPCVEEQEKIANILTKMDELIENEKQILEQWKLLKKGLLQQMFVSEGKEKLQLALV